MNTFWTIMLGFFIAPIALFLGELVIALITGGVVSLFA